MCKIGLPFSTTLAAPLSDTHTQSPADDDGLNTKWFMTKRKRILDDLWPYLVFSWKHARIRCIALENKGLLGGIAYYRRKVFIELGIRAILAADLYLLDKTGWHFLRPFIQMDMSDPHYTKAFSKIH